MVVHVYENAQKSNKLDDLVIAIDSEETKKALKDWNVKTVMTSKDHICGTDRVYEASKAYKKGLAFAGNFVGDKNKFFALACNDDLVQFHGALNALAGSVMKIANDIRF